MRNARLLTQNVAKAMDKGKGGGRGVGAGCWGVAWLASPCYGAQMSSKSFWSQPFMEFLKCHSTICTFTDAIGQEIRASYLERANAADPLRTVDVKDFQ